MSNIIDNKSKMTCILKEYLYCREVGLGYLEISSFPLIQHFIGLQGKISSRNKFQFDNNLFLNCSAELIYHKEQDGYQFEYLLNTNKCCYVNEL